MKSLRCIAILTLSWFFVPEVALAQSGSLPVIDFGGVLVGGGGLPQQVYDDYGCSVSMVSANTIGADGQPTGEDALNFSGWSEQHYDYDSDAYRCYVFAVFRPLDSNTNQRAILRIFIGDSSTEIDYELRGDGVDPNLLSLSAAAVDFGTQPALNGPFLQTIVLRNAANVTVIPPSPAIDSGAFSATACEAAIPAGGQCVIELRFFPSSIGSYSGTLTLPGTALVASLTGVGVLAPVPILTSLSPSTYVEASQFTFVLTATGQNLGGGVLLLNGVQQTAVSASATYISAYIGTYSVGTNSVTVRTPSGTSAALPLTILPALPPVLTSISPASAPAGSSDLELTLHGDHLFRPVVLWNGIALQPTGMDESLQNLWVWIPHSYLASPGIAYVAVRTPAGTSAPQTFTIGPSGPPSTPVLSSISPSSSAAGSASFTLAAYGSNFVSSSIVLWAGSARPTTYVSATQLTAQIDAADLVSPGIQPVTVSTPGVGTSASQTFVINDPPPSRATLAVSVQNATMAYGSALPTFTCTITGTVQPGDQVTASCATSATTTSPVGTYPITVTLGGAQAGKYIASGGGTLTVTPATLKIAADDFSRVVGAPNPAFTGVFSGVRNNDPVTAAYATTATQSSPAGSYPIVPTAVGAASVLNNYAVNAVNGTLTIVANDVIPQTGWWWNAGQSGMGVFVERQGKDLFMAGLAYNFDGSPTWAIALGPVSSSLFVGKVHQYRAGQTLTGPYVAPLDNGPQQNVQLQFLDPANATLTWYGQTIALQRLQFAGAGARPGAIQNGWWWNTAESGRGFLVEVEGNSLFMAGLMYDGRGGPTWYLANGTMSGPMQFTGVWQQYGNGPLLTGCSAPAFGGCVPAFLTNPNVGTVTVVFSDPSHGTMTLPDGRQIPIQRLFF